MSQTIRFPLLDNVPSVGNDESALVITLASAVVSLPIGGSAGGALLPWKTIQRNTESPFSCAVIEFTASAALVIGDGTFAQQIGLYGGIRGSGGTISRFLLGTLGIARGGVAPQIPLVSAAGPVLVGYAQQVSQIAVYDTLSVGGVSGAIPIVGGTVTVRARPIRARDYMG